MKNYIILFFLALSFPLKGEARDDLSPKDPYAETNYDKAFSSTVLMPYIDVLRHYGAIENLSEEITFKSHEPRKLDDANYAVRRQEMLDAIKRQLEIAKRDAVLKPAYEGALVLATQGIATGVLIYSLSTESYGGGFGSFVFMNLLGGLSRNMTKALYNYMRPGNDPYARWEMEFAKKMPYIPSKLWPKIIDIFGAARMGSFSYVKATEFFEIAFNLPTIHRFPYSPPLTIDQVPEKADTINGFTTHFFEDYDKNEEARDALNSSVRTYLRKLAKNENGFICLHLEGPGGIGKTHYIKALSAKISETFGQDMPMEEINIRSSEPSELEGDKDTPGQILTTLSRIAKRGLPYGILVFDEASWLNSEHKESAKKIFEPDLGSFKSEYLDSLEFSLKGFLAVFLSNYSIEDPALKSRMINIKFPSLKKDSLKKLALANLNKYLSGTNLLYEQVAGTTEIASAIEKASTMRDIKTSFPLAIEKILYGRKAKNEVH